jgi:hypothetical protein
VTIETMVMPRLRKSHRRKPMLSLVRMEMLGRSRRPRWASSAIASSVERASSGGKGIRVLHVISGTHRPERSRSLRWGLRLAGHRNDGDQAATFAVSHFSCRTCAGVLNPWRSTSGCSLLVFLRPGGVRGSSWTAGRVRTHWTPLSASGRDAHERLAEPRCGGVVTSHQATLKRACALKTTRPC